MSKRLSITEARNRFLALPDELVPGEEVQVYRHQRPVLKVVRTGSVSGQDPFAILDSALEGLVPSQRRLPRTLAARYKTHLYGKKK